MTHYRVWRERALPFYARHPFYRGEMHRIIRPAGGRFIFPKGVHPIIGRRGQVIYPRGIRPVPFRTRRLPVKFRPLTHFKPVKPIIPVKRRILPPPPSHSFRHGQVGPLPSKPSLNRFGSPVKRSPSQSPYTTGPIMKHPIGIYRGIGIPPRKQVNRGPSAPKGKYKTKSKKKNRDQ